MPLKVYLHNSIIIANTNNMNNIMAGQQDDQEMCLSPRSGNFRYLRNQFENQLGQH